MSMQERFDQNRNMAEAQVEELSEVIRRQEESIQQLQNQLQQQHVQIQLQNIQQGHPQQGLLLTPKELLTQFRQLKSLDKDHDATAFIASVEAVLALCPRENQQLMNLATAIIMNEKICGDAGDYIRGLGTDATWDQIKAKLIDHHRPRTTYADIFSKCRNVKVSNLRELFNYFERSKAELNKIYMYDDKRPEMYEPCRVDKDLVHILVEKIDVPLRSHSSQSDTLSEIITKYTRIKALDDPRTIHYHHKKKTHRYKLIPTDHNKHSMITKNHNSILTINPNNNTVIISHSNHNTIINNLNILIKTNLEIIKITITVIIIRNKLEDHI